MKNNNQITINLNDALMDQIEKLSIYHQRKKAELLRLIITPGIIAAYAEMQRDIHPDNKATLQRAIFKK